MGILNAPKLPQHLLLQSLIALFHPIQYTLTLYSPDFSCLKHWGRKKKLIFCYVSNPIVIVQLYSTVPHLEADFCLFDVSLD